MVEDQSQKLQSPFFFPARLVIQEEPKERIPG